MSLFRKISQKFLDAPRLCVRQLGPHGELLEEQEIRKHGSYILGNWSRRFEIQRGVKRHLSEQIKLNWKKRDFKLEIPSFLKLKEPALHLSSELPPDLNCISFEWKKTPSRLQLLFPNKNLIEIEKSSFNAFSFSRLLNSFSNVGLMIIAGHLLLGFFVLQSLRFSAAEAVKKQEFQQRIDLSKLNPIHLVSKEDFYRSQRRRTAHPTKSLTPEHRQHAHMRHLMRSWGVGGAIRSANQVLPKSKMEDLFRNEARAHRTSKNVGTWQLDDSDIQQTDRTKELNLSAVQLANALRPIIPSLKECYDDALIRDPGIKGDPRLWIDVNKNGSIVGVTVENLHAQRKESLPFLQNCFKKAYSKVKFPKRPNQAFIVTRTMVLEQI